MALLLLLTLGVLHRILGRDTKSSQAVVYRNVTKLLMVVVLLKVFVQAF